jgi:diaminopimelate decarboxylase
MNHFQYRGAHLYAEEVPLQGIAAALGTPTYVYSRATLERHVGVMTQAFEGAPTLLCYAVKANPNLALLKLLHERGCGFDIVSGGELERVKTACGGDVSKVVFSGVGKTEEELAAALRAGILLFNVESEEELHALDRVGRALRKKARFALRVNPDVDPKTHRYIATGLRTSKFGVPFEQARALYRASRKLRGVTARGIDCHIGSQLTKTAPLRAALEKIAGLYQELRAEGFGLSFLDVGGGLGITYQAEEPPSPAEYAKVVRTAVGGLGATLLLEPGRVLVGNAGVLLTRVLYRKSNGARTFVVVDAGMNDLVRPALYEAHHELRPVQKRRGKRAIVDVVGPVCESSDVLARQRTLTLPAPGELMAVMSAGAYGMSMASTYNSRPRPAEVLVEGEGFRVIREREKVSELWRGERP